MTSTKVADTLGTSNDGATRGIPHDDLPSEASTPTAAIVSTSEDLPQTIHGATEEDKIASIENVDEVSQGHFILEYSAHHFRKGTPYSWHGKFGARHCFEGRMRRK
jgi:hypothetical protein